MNRIVRKKRKKKTHVIILLQEKYLTPEWIMRFRGLICAAPVLMVDANLNSPSLEASCQSTLLIVLFVLSPLSLFGWIMELLIISFLPFLNISAFLSSSRLWVSCLVWAGVSCQVPKNHFYCQARKGYALYIKTIFIILFLRVYILKLFMRK